MRNRKHTVCGQLELSFSRGLTILINILLEVTIVSLVNSSVVLLLYTRCFWCLWLLLTWLERKFKLLLMHLVTAHRVTWFEGRFKLLRMHLVRLEGKFKLSLMHLSVSFRSLKGFRLCTLPFLWRVVLGYFSFAKFCLDLDLFLAPFVYFLLFVVVYFAVSQLTLPYFRLC
jgi:hypothetical protein